MSIFVDENTKVVVQGLTGGQGRFHGLRNRAYGTKVVAGVTPGKGGEDVEGIPVFDTVAEAVERHRGRRPRSSRCRRRCAAAAILEAAAAGIAFIVCITEGIPAQDEALRLQPAACATSPAPGCSGPNCPGIISPGQVQHRHHLGRHRPAGGPVGIVSRSGTLTYQALHELSQQGVGQTTCVGIGGDPVPGTNFIDCLAAFEADPETRAVMMIGEIGGSEEERAAEFIADRDDQAGRRLHRRRHRARRAARWATPGPSSRAPRAPPRPRWRRSPAAGVARRRRTRPRPASGWSRSSGRSADRSGDRAGAVRLRAGRAGVGTGRRPVGPACASPCSSREAAPSSSAMLDAGVPVRRGRSPTGRAAALEVADRRRGPAELVDRRDWGGFGADFDRAATPGGRRVPCRTTRSTWWPWPASAPSWPRRSSTPTPAGSSTPTPPCSRRSRVGTRVATPWPPG